MPCSRADRSQLAPERLRGGFGDQSQLARFRNRRTSAQHVKILALDAVQNLFAASTEQLDIYGKFAIDHSDERTPSSEPIVRSLNFELHEVTELRREATFGDFAFADPILFEVLER